MLPEQARREVGELVQRVRSESWRHPARTYRFAINNDQYSRLIAACKSIHDQAEPKLRVLSHIYNPVLSEFYFNFNED